MPKLAYRSGRTQRRWYATTGSFPTLFKFNIADHLKRSRRVYQPDRGQIEGIYVRYYTMECCLISLVASGE